MLNTKFEKAIFLEPNKNKGFEFGYAGGVYFQWPRILPPGIEFYGGIRGSDRVLMNFNIELERFVAVIWSP